MKNRKVTHLKIIRRASGVEIRAMGKNPVGTPRALGSVQVRGEKVQKADILRAVDQLLQPEQLVS